MNAVSLSGLDARDMGDVVAQVGNRADAFGDARILVTGATGWFGTWLLDALVNLNRARGLGLRITALSRDPDAFARRHPRLHAAREIDWRAIDVRRPLVGVGPFTHVVHAATDASEQSNRTHPDRMFDTIVSGTRHVLELVARQRDAKLLLVSSGAVYGAQPADVARFSESYAGAPDVLDPASAYAEGKRAAEQLAAIWHAKHGVHAAIARCFAFVGPHMPFDAHFAIGNFIRDALRGDPIRVASDGTSLRSYLYTTDLIVWLLAILVDAPPMRPFNVGGETAVSIAELAERCAAVSNGSSAVRIGSASAGRNYLPDTSRAQSELGLRQTVSLADAIERTAAWKRHDAQVPA